MNKDFWKGKRVLISGHSGFKGSWLCLWLKLLGAYVSGFSLPNPPTTPNLYDLARVEDLIDVCWKADIRNYLDIKDCIEKEKPEIIFHMAAQAIVKDGFLDPLTTFQTNIMGTANLMEACRQIDSIRAIISVATDKVYEDKQWPWGYREIDPLGANDPYSSSKACSDLITATYRQDKMGNLPVATARAGNVIAGGDFAHRVVPIIVEALIKGQSPPIWDPYAIRPWQFILDCLAGYLILAEKLYVDPSKYCGNWNFGPSEEDYITVGELAIFLNDKWKGQKTFTKVECPDLYNLNVDLRLNSSKSRRILGWKPQWDIYKTIDRVVNWYKNYSLGWDARDLVHYDIKIWEKVWL